MAKQVKRSPPKVKKSKASRQEFVEQMDFVESLMVRRLSERQIFKLLADRYGMGERQGYRYLTAVRERWAQEANDMGRSARRDHLRKSIEDLYVRALATSVTKPDPDVRAATRAAKLLIEIDAVMADPPKQGIELTGTVGVATTTVSASTRAGLEAWLMGSSPRA